MSIKCQPSLDVEIAQLVDRLTRRVHTEIHHRSRAFDTDRIGPVGGFILMTLADIEPAPIHVLVRQITRDKSQVTRVLQKLETKGLIERRNSAEDARVFVLRLTQKGHDKVAQLSLVLAEAIDVTLAPLAPRQRETLKKLLKQGLS